jgi:hypothetical protein
MRALVVGMSLVCLYIGGSGRRIGAVGRGGHNRIDGGGWHRRVLIRVG